MKSRACEQCLRCPKIRMTINGAYCTEQRCKVEYSRSPPCGDGEKPP